MTEAARFATLLLSVGPTPVYTQRVETVAFLNGLALEVFVRRPELDRHLNNALIRDACPALAPLAKLLATVLSRPDRPDCAAARDGAATVEGASAQFDSLTIGDVARLLGVLNALGSPRGKTAHDVAVILSGEAAHG